ncbi:MAG: hypothetical protein Q9223_001252 [Gallowayella weberi]
MSEAPQQTRQWKPIALVPVGLKEAALDSPTFRSAYTHFTEQVDLVEKWLETWLKSVSKITNEVGPTEGIINSFLSQAIPPTNLAEAVLDHDYTLLAVKRYGEAAREIWTSTILSMKKMELNMVEPIRSLMQNDLRNFKESRRVFEQTQKAYDGLLYRYSAQAKTKEPSSLREDAFQLHEARKAYLKASMDFSIIAPQLRVSLDKVLVKIFSDQWRDMRNAKDSLNGPTRRWNKDIERVRSWSHELEAGEAAFRKELLNARRQIEDSTEARARPSRELDDYSPPTSQTIGSRSLPRTDSQDAGSNALANGKKQGWLFLRTLSGKPTRTVWVRRWGFVQNGIFGWLVQGSRSGAVEESDRIGVLLCNIRHAQSEERRFSFEVKTKDSSIILQAESQADLAAWMEAFERAKQIALENSASADSPAFAITSPSAPEFAADPGVSQYREDGPIIGLERGSTLSIPGTESGFGLPSRSSTDVSSPRRSTGGDRDGESGRDHASRIIQKLDIHRKSTGGPQQTSGPGSPPLASPALAGGGIASLIAASHHVMPVGPGILPQPPPIDGQTSRAGGSRGLYNIAPSTLAPETLAVAPAPTNLSAAAVIISGERGIDQDAMGVISNTWGSSYKGYLNRLERDDEKAPSGITAANRSSPEMRSTVPSSESPRVPTKSMAEDKPARSTTPSPSHRKTSSLPGGAMTLPSSNVTTIDYPKDYSIQLKTQDAQFRLFFPNVPRTERVLLVFRATWSLNEQQEFPGRVYVTASQMYFYSHHLGLILTSGIKIDTISEVTAAPGRDYDLLFVHLKDSSDNMPSTRITIKAFLEPLKVLQQRLELLVKSYKPEGEPDVESIMQELIKVDRTDAATSPIKDRWEDFTTATATSDDGRIGRNDLRAAVMFDGGTNDNRYRSDGNKAANRIKLPRQPVVFIPAGMDRVVVDKIFDISSKALFHVMFGDRSALWQLLYHERLAQRIKQSAWVRSEQSHLRREFEYQIGHTGLFGVVRYTAVTDYQMIDSLNEHLCYVVTDRKTPWALPHGRDLSLLTKIVITHHAKSKCKLAIYTKVDWTKRPGWLEGLITKQALKDLALDALDLSDLITDQVRKLGAHSRTKKAIQIFGHVGVSSTGSEFTGSDAPISTRARRSIKPRTLAGLLASSVISLGRNIISTVTRGVFALVGWMWNTVNANVVIMLILAISALANLFFSSAGTVQWWKDRQVVNYLGRIGVGSDHLMTKAVMPCHTYIAHTLSSRATFDTFLGSTEVDLATASGGAVRRNVAGPGSFGGLRRSRQRLGTRRHDLLVALRVINSIEREMVEAEWEEWLEEENARCKQMAMLILKNRTVPFTGDHGKEVSDQQPSGNRDADRTRVLSWHENYCGSCAREKEVMNNVGQIGSVG